MQSTQRPTRRKTTRHLFEDEDEPPAKRSKLETNTATNGASKQTNGKAVAPKPKRAKKSYDEDADGFQFTRKTRSTQAQSEPAPVQASEPSTSKQRATTATKRKKDSPQHSGSSEPEQRRTRRRSARLSGENEQVEDQAPAARPKRLRNSNEHVGTKPVGPSKYAPSLSNQRKGTEVGRDGSPAFVAGEIQVEKSRDGTKIALPFADTPIIRRNKEMRQQTKSKHRRSSTGLRGRRASSLIESGTSNAVPHAEVSIPDFYKHIEQSLPEPRRMKQLLTWCGTRALPEKAHGGTGDANEMLAKDSARHISEELLKDFANKPEMSDWFSREDVVDQEDAFVVKKPNPRNLRNAEKLKELEAEIQRLQDEKKSWEGLLSSKPPSRAQPLGSGIINAELLDPSQAAILDSLQTTMSSSTISSIPTKSSQNEANPTSRPSHDISARLNSLTQTVEPNIDLFADGIHKITQYRLAAERVADRILSATAEKLEERDREAREASGTRGVGAKEVLFALGGALSERSR